MKQSEVHAVQYLSADVVVNSIKEANLTALGYNFFFLHPLIDVNYGGNPENTLLYNFIAIAAGAALCFVFAFTFVVKILHEYRIQQDTLQRKVN